MAFRIPKKRYLVLIFLLLLFLGKYVVEIGPDRSPADRFKVTKIIDGDTIELAGGDRLRLLGLDTPEKGKPFSDSAGAFLSSLILGRNIDVSFSRRRRDGYGRLLGYIYIDSIWVNKELVENGLANLYLFEDNLADREKIEELLVAQNQAIDGRRGIWSLNKQEEEYYIAVRGSHRFHRPSCRSLKRLDVGDLIKFSSRLEPFKQGYSPCRNCQP